MKFQLALIEDRETHRRRFVEAVRQYCNAHPEDSFSVFTIKSSDDFEAIFDERASFDAIFIDIELDALFPNRNGMDLAKTMRERSYQGEIVFLTSHMDYALEGYGLDALAYLSKPLKHEQLSEILKKIQQRQRPKNWYFKSKEAHINLPYHQIYYFSVNRHWVTVHSKSLEKKFRASLLTLAQGMPEQFVFCHRSFLVNLEHVQCIYPNELLLSNQVKLPISRNYYKSLVQAFSRWV